jgi:hypothetical protein
MLFHTGCHFPQKFKGIALVSFKSGVAIEKFDTILVPDPLSKRLGQSSPGA